MTALIASLLASTACTYSPVQNKEQSSNTVRADSLEVRLMQHLSEFEKIAAQHGGNRAVGTEGAKATAALYHCGSKKSGIERPNTSI